MDQPEYSIIIPACNEAANIGQLVAYLRMRSTAPIVVANSPNTTDDTAQIACKAGAIVLQCSKAGRAAQMNFAAHNANGRFLYFVHADTFPPEAFELHIDEALKKGASLGYFSYRFSSPRLLLKINSYFTRFNGFFAGGGDQTLFITRALFDALGGFREELDYMEDFDLVHRAVRLGHSPVLINDPALVSARKYDNNSWLRVNLVNLLVFSLFKMGASQPLIKRILRRCLRP